MRVEVFPSFSSRDNAVEWGKNLIELAAQNARSRYTTLTPGQQEAYAAKLVEAEQVLCYGQTDFTPPTKFPWIEFEAAATGKDMPTLAAEILKAAGRYKTLIGPQIEAARIAGKIAVENAGSVPELCRAARAAEAALNQI